MRTRLGDNDLGRNFARNGFSDRQHVMFSGSSKQLFFAAGVVILPGKDPGFVQIMENFAADSSIVVKRQTVDIHVILNKSLGRDDI